MKTKLMLSMLAVASFSFAARASEVPTGDPVLKVCGSQGMNPLLEVTIQRYGAPYVYVDIKVSRPSNAQETFERKIGYVYEKTEDTQKIQLGHVKDGRFVAEAGQSIYIETVAQGQLTRGKISYKTFKDDIQCFLNFD